MTALRLQVGNLDQKVDRLGEKLDGFITERDQAMAANTAWWLHHPGGRRTPSDKVRYRDFSIDLRTAPAAACTWLAAARPTRSCGLYWSTNDPGTALGRSYDILIHLHQVEAGHLR
ncbi:hypothetical protein [Streptomyces nigrescens]